jgi:hypothetical protein
MVSVTVSEHEETSVPAGREVNKNYCLDGLSARSVASKHKNIAQMKEPATPVLQLHLVPMYGGHPKRLSAQSPTKILG